MTTTRSATPRLDEACLPYQLASVKKSNYNMNDPNNKYRLATVGKIYTLLDSRRRQQRSSKRRQNTIPYVVFYLQE